MSNFPVLRPLSLMHRLRLARPAKNSSMSNSCGGGCAFQVNQYSTLFCCNWQVSSSKLMFFVQITKSMQHASSLRPICGKYRKINLEKHHACIGDYKNKAAALQHCNWRSRHSKASMSWLSMLCQNCMCQNCMCSGFAGSMRDLCQAPTRS